jgi:hypothetical protein
MALRLSALRAGRPLPAGRFLVIISVKGWVDLKAIVRLEGLGELKKSNYLIGNRTGDLPTCTIVPQLRYSPELHQLTDCIMDLRFSERWLWRYKNFWHVTRKSCRNWPTFRRLGGKYCSYLQDPRANKGTTSTAARRAEDISGLYAVNLPVLSVINS